MTKGMDRQVRLALRAARTLHTELKNSAALASGSERFALIQSARHAANAIETLKELLRRFDANEFTEQRMSEHAAEVGT